LKAIAALAADNVAAHALGYAAASAPLLLTLALWIAGTAVAEGLRREGLEAADAGPDILVSARALGRHTPIDAEICAKIRGLNGVERVERRVLGTVEAGATQIMIAGVERERLRKARELDNGAAPASEGECLVGAELASELGLKPGSHIALEAALTRVYSVSGVLRAGDALAGSKALIVEVEEAQALFGENRFSDLCVWTLPGYAEAVARAAERSAPGIVSLTRSQTREAIGQAANHRSGALSALLAPLLALATASFCALSWFANTRRGTEIAQYKLAGFTGGDILILSLIENAFVAIALGCTAFLIAWIWIRVLGAPLLAPYLIPDLGLFPKQSIPASFTPLPLGLGLALAFATTQAGSIFASWRLSLARTAKAFA
jgi:ABC-type lipoprotein release transport system permease subunit